MKRWLKDIWENVYEELICVMEDSLYILFSFIIVPILTVGMFILLIQIVILIITL